MFKHDFESVPEYSFEPAVAEPVSEHTVEPVADIYKTNVDITELTPSHSENTEEVKDEPVSSSFVSDDYDVETIEPTPVATEEKYPAFEGNSWSQSAEENAWTKPAETTDYSAQEYAQNFAKETDPAEYAKDFSIQPSIEPTEPVPSTNNYEFETGYDLTPTEPVITTQDEKFGSFEVENGKAEASFPESFETVSQPVETVSQPVSTPPKSRLSERNVDLPIEVSEDERRLHNDARRFARLLVSEIKLYNEQKVKEGRDAGDIYERLREAIDRSREMYDKRVQPAVAAKFDYFHYELVNTLAEGDDKKLGAGYPGAVV